MKRNRIPMVCPCGKAFERVPSNTDAKYCSRPCTNKYGQKAVHPLPPVDGMPVYLDNHGYARLQVGRLRKHLHKYLAEKWTGLDLTGRIVHHIDGDKLNNDKSNLVILENRGEHNAIHARALLVARGGRPGLDLFCPRCKKVLPLSQFTKNRSSYNGYYSYCKSCRVTLPGRRV